MVSIDENLINWIKRHVECDLIEECTRAYTTECLMCRHNKVKLKTNMPSEVLDRFRAIGRFCPLGEGRCEG